MSASDSIAWREQSDLDRKSRNEKEERIRKAALADPALPYSELAERFGCPRSTIARVCKRAGIKREPTGYGGLRSGGRAP